MSHLKTDHGIGRQVVQLFTFGRTVEKNGFFVEYEIDRGYVWVAICSKGGHAAYVGCTQHRLYLNRIGYLALIAPHL